MRALFALIVLFAWAYGASAETITADSITVHYSLSDHAVAQQTLEDAQAFCHEQSARLPKGDAPITIVIAATVDEFVQHAGDFGRSDVGGLAIPSRGFILLKSPRLASAPPDYTGVLRHELVHVLLYRNVNIAALPGWLNEGICMYVSREHRWASAMRVGQMYASGEILNYREIEFAFVAFQGERPFGDIYAQSLSMTRYLINAMGEDDFWRMIGDLDTMDFRSAIKKHTGWSAADFWNEWNSSLWSGAIVTSVVSGVTLFQVGAVLLLLGWWRKRREGQVRLAEMEDDEKDPLMPWEVPLEQGPYDWEEDDEDDRY